MNALDRALQELTELAEDLRFQSGDQEENAETAREIEKIVEMVKASKGAEWEKTGDERSALRNLGGLT